MSSMISIVGGGSVGGIDVLVDGTEVGGTEVFVGRIRVDVDGTAVNVLGIVALGSRVRRMGV